MASFLKLKTRFKYLVYKNLRSCSKAAKFIRTKYEMLWQPAYMHKLNFDRNNFLLEIIKIKGQAQTLMNMQL